MRNLNELALVWATKTNTAANKEEPKTNSLRIMN
jgi:hypothetical protein